MRPLGAENADISQTTTIWTLKCNLQNLGSQIQRRFSYFSTETKGSPTDELQSRQKKLMESKQFSVKCLQEKTCFIFHPRSNEMKELVPYCFIRWSTTIRLIFISIGASFCEKMLTRNLKIRIPLIHRSLLSK